MILFLRGGEGGGGQIRCIILRDVQMTNPV